MSDSDKTNIRSSILFPMWARICKPFKESRNRFPAWLNWFLGSLNRYKYGLWIIINRTRTPHSQETGILDETCFRYSKSQGWALARPSRPTSNTWLTGRRRRARIRMTATTTLVRVFRRLRAAVPPPSGRVCRRLRVAVPPPSGLPVCRSLSPVVLRLENSRPVRYWMQSSEAEDRNSAYFSYIFAFFGL